MGRAYYYFAASLPFLGFDVKPAIRYDYFLEGCRSQLAEEDLDFIGKARLEYDGDPVEKNSFLNEWLKFHRGLRNELAWIRAEELNRDPYDHMRGDRHIEPMIVDVIAEASKSPDPLVAEKLLDRIKWQKLDELLAGHYFDIEFLMAYSLKLQILERYQAINSPTGEENFKQYQDLALSATKEKI